MRFIEKMSFHYWETGLDEYLLFYWVSYCISYDNSNDFVVALDAIVLPQIKYFVRLYFTTNEFLVDQCYTGNILCFPTTADFQIKWGDL